MEAKNGSEGGKILGPAITELDRRELCNLVARLCSLIQQEAGTGAYRGGIFPDNISVTEEGELALGPAADADWTGQERDFLAPELFWQGEKGPASDVYSLGMLLYYAVSGGRLPFAVSGEDGARQRRMNGEAIRVPEAAGRRLGEIIVKATAFQTADRYQSAEELKAALISCVDNIYLDGPVSAETVYHKGEKELSKVEKMLLNILRREEKPEIVRNDTEFEETPQEPVVGPLMPDPEPQPEPQPEEPAQKETPEANAEPVVILTEEKNPELEPVVISRNASVQYQNSAEREKKIAGKVRLRRIRRVFLLLLICGLLVAAAFLYDHLQKKQQEAEPENTAESTVSEELPGIAPDESIDMSKPMPEIENAPQSEETGIVSHVPEETPEPTPEVTPEPKNHRYEVIKADVSWIQARDSAISAGGHLVVINDEAEFNRVLEQAAEVGASYFWVGCRRVDGALAWDKDITVDYMPWLAGEPTVEYEGVPEDYVMLAYINGAWGYNDIGNNPAGDWPEFYSGRIAYIIEFDD